ncbi:MAG: PAS domain-containing sensor histidine kinase [Anaerolineales bacterium]|nr:PAS domain-containing sensor histidine kinase [Anaerolineales bacterium]
MHPDDLEYAETTLQEAVRTDNPWQTVFRIVLPDGAIRHMLASSVIDYDRKGAPLRMIGINRDVSKQMAYEQFLQEANAKLEQRVAERTIELRNLVAELEQANAGKDAFLAAVSHELRTPLMGILGMAENLYEELPGPLNEQQKRYVTAITGSGERLLHVVNSVLRYVAAITTTAPPALERCRMVELCTLSVRNAKARASAKQQIIQVVIEPFDMEVRTNGDLVIQLIDVLLDNAIKFTAKQGQLGVKVVERLEEGAFQLEVWDTGIGISKGQRTPCSNHLHRWINGSRAYEGIGLGLAHARRIVELLGGTIEVMSEVEKGSQFVVVLPANMVDK